MLPEILLTLVIGAAIALIVFLTFFNKIKSKRNTALSSNTDQTSKPSLKQNENKNTTLTTKVKARKREKKETIHDEEKSNKNKNINLSQYQPSETPSHSPYRGRKPPIPHRPQPHHPPMTSSTFIPIFNQQNITKLKKNDTGKINENKNKALMINRLLNEIQTQNKEITLWKTKNGLLNNDNKMLRESNSKLLDEEKEMKLEINNLSHEIKKLSQNVIDPTKYAEWDHQDIIDWILSLENGFFELNYGDVLRREIAMAELTGTDLIEMNTNDMKGIGIAVFKHRKLLEKHIQTLSSKNANIGNVEGVNAPTAYIYN